MRDLPHLPMPMPPLILSLLETRVLGVLVEKQHTVPDTYPLTLLALTGGCNQKTSRDPVMNASETEVQAALDRLKTLSFVVESSGGRVMRYAHNVERVLAIPSQAVALIAAADAARAADHRRTADQLRSPASLRGHLRGRGIPARARVPAGGSARDRVVRASPAPAKRDGSSPVRGSFG